MIGQMLKFTLNVIDTLFNLRKKDQHVGSWSLVETGRQREIETGCSACSDERPEVERYQIQGLATRLP